MTTSLAEKIGKLTNEELLILSEELSLPTVPDNALILEVIKGTEVDTTAPMLAFLGVGHVLSFELAERFKYALDVIEILQGRK